MTPDTFKVCAEKFRTQYITDKMITSQTLRKATMEFIMRALVEENEEYQEGVDLLKPLVDVIY